MIFDEVFTNTVESLLAGKFICPITCATSYDFLNSDINRERVQTYLYQTGKTLSHIDHEFYYASYESMTPDRRRASRAVFKQTQQEIRPVVEFLSLMMRVSNDERSLYTGDEIHLAQIVSKIENDKSLLKSLDRIIIQIKGQLKGSVFDKTKQLINSLVKTEILKQIEPKIDIYLCTGKLAYYINLMEFIMTYQAEKFDDIDLDEPAQDDLI
ncbi:condensin complex protein MksE [Colwellia sp. MB3u-4]|uniref:condensin complex protein MksE n=1 Tax=Colwellia sp. MB3u-4 TaxID=2759822 RepID=UPI0015F55AF8|nr:hypothetical protein [Colwellia sp. MB3u-4]MBA6287856.1 hypothetical protein [Colwellia sp. MB3u-4]